MKKPIDKARALIREAVGHNDNSHCAQTAQLIFHAPVTIVLGNTFKNTFCMPFKAKSNVNDLVPAYLSRRRKILANLPPYTNLHKE